MLVGTMHSICKVRGSNPGHHKKKKNLKYLVILKHDTSYAMMVKCISISFALFKKKIHHSLCPKNNNYSLLRSAIGNGIIKRGVEETSLRAG